MAHPEAAAVHNQLGYLLVEHGGDLAVAERHLAQARFLAPGDRRAR
ncbi:MAG: hypothetical protein R2939_04450 [Kofleriaceae bacterium]